MIDKLHELWTNVECVPTGVSAGETRLAFDIFCRNLKMLRKKGGAERDVSCSAG